MIGRDSSDACIAWSGFYLKKSIGGGGGGGGELCEVHNEHHMALQGEGVGGKCTPSCTEHEDFCKWCTETCKASFLAQIDFSWSRYVL